MLLLAWPGTSLRAVVSRTAAEDDAWATSGVSVGDAMIGGRGVKERIPAEGRLECARGNVAGAGGGGEKGRRAGTERLIGTAGLWVAARRSSKEDLGGSTFIEADMMADRLGFAHSR